jgi:plasmid stability protein
MATTQETEAEERTIVASWVSTRLAREIKELAARDGRSVSGLIRVALRDRLQTETSPMGEDRRQAGLPRSPPRAPVGGGSAAGPVSRSDRRVELSHPRGMPERMSANG